MLNLVWETKATCLQMSATASITLVNLVFCPLPIEIYFFGNPKNAEICAGKKRDNLPSNVCQFIINDHLCV